MAKYSGACIAKDCLKERKSSNIIKIQQNKIKRKCIKKKKREKLVQTIAQIKTQQTHRLNI